MADEEEKIDGRVVAPRPPPSTPKELERRTQSAIRSLHELSKVEYLTPSFGDPYAVSRDPHLRLRRTLAPSANVGIPKYAEAQFMLSREETTGRRVRLEFGVSFDGDDNGGDANASSRKLFTMDGYAFGATEDKADVRVVALHGISPGVSRTRWHRLGERYDAIAGSSSDGEKKTKKVRFVALDWHSIDRSVDDGTNTEFLTCLPKHIMETTSDESAMEEIVRMFDSEERREWCQKFSSAINGGICPRTFDDGGKILRSVIEEGLGWGTKDKRVVLAIKSWSGGLGMRMLAQVHRGRASGGGGGGTSFADNVQGAIIMHPACFDRRDIVDAMSYGVVPSALMCWARDDPLVPYGVSRMYVDAAARGRTELKLSTYERGGHHNFDGSDTSLPNFDDEVIEWIEGLP